MDDLRNYQYDSDEVVDPDLLAIGPSRAHRNYEQAAMPPGTPFPAALQPPSTSFRPASESRDYVYAPDDLYPESFFGDTPRHQPFAIGMAQETARTRAAAAPPQEESASGPVGEAGEMLGGDLGLGPLGEMSLGGDEDHREGDGEGDGQGNGGGDAMKRCEKKTCGRLLPLSDFMRFLKDETRIESKHCKSCRAAHAAQDGEKRRAAVVKAKEVAGVGMKKCDRKGCGRVLPLEHFEGRQAGPNKWYTACAECRGLDAPDRQSLMVTLRLDPRLLGDFPGGTRRGGAVVGGGGYAGAFGGSEADERRRRPSGFGKRSRNIGDMAFGTRAPKRAKSVTKKQSSMEDWQPANKAPKEPEESVYDSGTNDEEEKQAKRDRRRRR